MQNFLFGLRKSHVFGEFPPFLVFVLEIWDCFDLKLDQFSPEKLPHKGWESRIFPSSKGTLASVFCLLHLVTLTVLRYKVRYRFTRAVTRLPFAYIFEESINLNSHLGTATWPYLSGVAGRGVESFPEEVIDLVEAIESKEIFLHSDPLEAIAWGHWGIVWGVWGGQGREVLCKKTVVKFEGEKGWVKKKQKRVGAFTVLLFFRWCFLKGCGNV